METIKIKKVIRILFCFCLSAKCVSAQGFPVDTILNRMVKQINLYPQEKLYVHADRSTYVAG